MNIDKLIPVTGETTSQGRFGSLMNIDKLIRKFMYNDKFIVLAL